MKYFYIVYEIREDINAIDGKPSENPKWRYYAGALIVSENDNLMSRFAGINGLFHTQIIPTKKKAKEIANMWNNEYKRNGEYLFDDPAW